MKNKVKYASERKYRDIGFEEVPVKKEQKKVRIPLLLKKRETFFQKIKRVIKNILKK